MKHDSTAIVAVSPLPDGRLRLAVHRVFQPTPEEPLDFEQAIEATLLDLCQRFTMIDRQIATRLPQPKKTEAA